MLKVLNNLSMVAEKYADVEEIDINDSYEWINENIKITGGNNVGGLVGSYVGSAGEENRIIGAFAAIKVESVNNQNNIDFIFDT